MLIHWVWLSLKQPVTDRMKRALLSCFSDAEAIFCAGPAEYKAVPELAEEAVASLCDKDLQEAQKTMAWCRAEEVYLLSYSDSRYPQRLKSIPDPPVLLYYKGTLPDFDALPAIGVVGTRQASAYGLQTAKRLGYQLARCGGLVVSGLAAGIDTMAMSGALMAGGTVVGVLGCGVDRIYPASNRRLYQDTQRYGCILSEYPMGTPPLKQNFPRRNRIVSGLSCGVLVVEAPEGSGALITAGRALDQGRDVFVVPGNIDNPCCAGSNRLLRDGAGAVSSGWDILCEYEGRFPGKLKNAGDENGVSHPERELAIASPEPEKHPQKKPRTRASGKENPSSGNGSDKKVVDKQHSEPYIDLNDTLTRLSADERTLVEAVRSGERLVDDVIAQTGLTTGKLLAAMTMLELKGIISRLPGKRIALRRRISK